MQTGAQLSLVVRLGETICALPIGCVGEVLRPLPIVPLVDLTEGVLGVSIVRGEPIPIVDGPQLFGAGQTRCERLVILRLASRRIGLTATSVLGLRLLAPDLIGNLPPLLAADGRVAGLAAMDGELLAVLDLARLVPLHVLSALEQRSAA
jgi:purine-binding chemotaxis protein CheW